MLSHTTVRTRSRLVLRTRISTALRSARQVPAKHIETTPFESYKQRGQWWNATWYRPKYNEKSLEKFFESAKIWVDKHPVIMKVNDVILFISILGLLISWHSPILFDWPHVLKEDVKAGVSAVLKKDPQKAIPPLSRSWLRIKSLPPEALSSDPNYKILKVASYLSGALCIDGQYLEAYRVLVDAMALRSQRQAQELKRYSDDDNAKMVPPVSIAERHFVIKMCFYLHDLAGQLGEQYSNDASYWLARAYVESVRLSRAHDVKTGEALYESPLTYTDQQFKLLLLGLGLDPYDPVFRVPNEIETCHHAWQDFLFLLPSEEESNTKRNAMAKSAEMMGDFAARLCHYSLAIEMFEGALSIKKVSRAPENLRTLRVLNKLTRATLNAQEGLAPTQKATKFPEVLSTWESYQPYIENLASRTDQGASLARELAWYYVLYGHLLLMTKDPDTATEKFRRGMAIAKASGCNDEAKIASEGLGSAHSQLTSGR